MTGSKTSQISQQRKLIVDATEGTLTILLTASCITVINHLGFLRKRLQMSNNAIPQTAKQREHDENKAEETKEPRGPLQTEHGITTIDESVVAKIAGMAAREIPGVYDMGNAVRRAFSAVTDRIPNAQTNVAGGISVQKGETQAAIEVTVVVEYGVSIVEVSDAIRRNVIEQLEGTTGLEIVEVNINVTDVHLPEDDSDKSEDTDLK
jgi:hypothetical protein